MRLIDADKLIEEINNLGWRLYDTLTLKGLSIALETIKEQPTAFNVEKVVEQLEKSHFHTDATFDDDGCCNDDSEEVVNLNEAIEIVKRGGIDEERS